MLFPLKINKEVYYAGMGEHEVRYVLTANDGRAIARDDYLETDMVEELNNYVTKLEHRINKIWD